MRRWWTGRGAVAALVPLLAGCNNLLGITDISLVRDAAVDADERIPDAGVDTRLVDAAADAPPIDACAGVGDSVAAGYCNIQFPVSMPATSGTTTSPVFGQVYQAGVTEPNGPAATVVGQLGLGPAASDPRSNCAWSWTTAVYNMQMGNNDEYRGTVTAPVVSSTTHFAYAYRFSIDSGATYTYCDLNGAGTQSGAFEPTMIGDLTVTP